MEILSPVQAELLRAAAAMVAKKEFDHLLYIGDLPLPEELVKTKSVARKKLVQAVTTEAQRQIVQAMGIMTLQLPTYDIARPERFKIALVTGISQGVFRDKSVVVGLIGRGPAHYPDTLYVVGLGDDQGGVDTGFGVVGTDRIPSAILEAAIDLAVDIAHDGWEGHPLGTILVIGDTAAVLEKSRQLTLNPFQGYSEAEKNILNPAVRDAIKNFAVLDGAFVIREDGVVLSAGRYLKFDEEDFELPLGLGARHTAAAGISKDTSAIAIAVSESSGIARVFQAGNCVLEIHPEQRSGRRGQDAGPVAGPEAITEVLDQLRSEDAPREAREGKDAKGREEKGSRSKETKGRDLKK